MVLSEHFSSFNASTACRTLGYVLTITFNIQNDLNRMLYPPSLTSSVHSVAPYRAVVEMVSGHSRIFSGEDVRLRCSIPDPSKSTWLYLWFHGSEELQQSTEQLTVWRARINDSGKYYCQGVWDTMVGQIRTLQSLPVEIFVDGKIDTIMSISASHYNPMSDKLCRNCQITQTLLVTVYLKCWTFNKPANDVTTTLKLR